jgi:hypothetical protein
MTRKPIGLSIPYRKKPEPTQKRPWVGLTDDEALALVEQDYRMEEYAEAAVQLIRRAEVELRKKNSEKEK